MKTLQMLRQQRMAQAGGGQPGRTLAPIAEGPAGLVEPVRVEGHHADAIALSLQARPIVNPLRLHQQHIPCPDLAPLAAIGIAMLPLDQQANVVLQVEVPGEGKAAVLGVDQANAGQTALDVSDLVHGAYSSAMGRVNLG